MISRIDILQTLRSMHQPVDWDAVYESELPRMYNYFLYKICNRELAQDLTATTFERAWATRTKYNVIIASPSTWLFGIARNVLRENFRKYRAIENKMEPIQDNEQLPSAVDVEQNFQQQQDKVLLQNLLLELPEREQDLVALKYGAGLSNREIARATGLSESNVGSILHRTVTTLQRKWDQCHER
jgi:RNA polymerase sigma-70 factor (ECF subfamily)